MKQIQRKAVALAVLLLLAVVVLAQTGDGASALFRKASRSSSRVGSTGHDLTWWTVDGGGGTASESGSGYTMMGTTGQPDAGGLTDGNYTLVGGFWGRGAVTEKHKIYLPVMLKSDQ